MGAIAKNHELYKLVAGPIDISYDIEKFVRAIRWCCQETKGLFSGNVEVVEEKAVVRFMFEYHDDAVLFKLTWAG